MCINQDKKSKSSRRRPRSSAGSPTTVFGNMDIVDKLHKGMQNEQPASPKTTSEKRKTKKSSSASRKGKSVSFFKEVTVRQVLHKNNFTEEEICDSWFQADEYTTIRKSVLKNLDLAKMDLFREGPESTYRGLEKYTSTGGIKESIRRRRQDAIWSVLDEQDLQVDKAEEQQLTYLVYDDKAIREVYKKHCRPTIDAARCAGRLDAQAASYENEPFEQTRCPTDSKSTPPAAKKKTPASIRRMGAPDTSPGAAPLIPMAA
ncbi:unnamed protein product [Pseudo-nitzschia multistriata]|uniref:Uncharacterized protein n=1 Tax=Pseudo-nitzschia multistriata TaxID=183589 RepID=A0A448Z1L4_9STRA|nr:unnamed protein product [Pseudo-nitzschia multistriata]